MSQIHPRMKEISLVHALMTLRGIRVEDLARHANVQLENLRGWLAGKHTALAHRSYIAILSYLGVTRSGLSGSTVQVWTLRAPKEFTSTQTESLRIIAGWLVGGQMIEITGDHRDFFNKTRVYAIRGKSFKILVHVKGGMRQPAELTPDLVPSVVNRPSPDGKPAISHVDALYWHGVRSSAITPAEFDDIFTDTYSEWSWHDLRLVARERGITPSALAEWVLQKDPKEQQGSISAVDASMSEDAVHTTASTPTRVSEPPIRARARKAEKVLSPVSVPTNRN